MGILLNQDSRIMVQGITGKEGSFHARACMAYGTKAVAGVTHCSAIPPRLPWIHNGVWSRPKVPAGMVWS